MLFKVIVIESRNIESEYVVSADSENEAREKALAGESEHERTKRIIGVVHRTINDMKKI